MTVPETKNSVWMKTKGSVWYDEVRKTRKSTLKDGDVLVDLGLPQNRDPYLRPS